MNFDYRIGEGYDIHRLVPNRDLIIGGVKIAFDKGLLGHSDADVLLHSICDALLGAAGLGDIGSQFPDDSLVFKDVSSIKLLGDTCKILAGDGFRPVNVDSTVIIELPRLADYIYRMRRTIAGTLKIDVGAVSVKATTNEGLGFIGAGEGIAARAVALIRQVV